MQVTLKLDRGDYDRINNVLGHLATMGAMYASDAFSSKADADAYAPIALERMFAVMPHDIAQRLVDDTDRQAQEGIAR